MEAVLQKDALTETFTDVQNLINKTVWQFHKRYGGNFDEWQAEAFLCFVCACKTYEEKHGQFTTWIRWCVWKGLLTYIGRLHRQWPYPNTTNEHLLCHLQDKKIVFFSPMELLDEANEDVKLLINLIWEPPPEITEADMKSGNHPCHIKVMLKNYLSKIGWTGARIKESFEEIERILYV